MSVAGRAESTGLVRVIGRWSLAALAINSVLGSGVFGLPATVASLLGPYSVVGVFIASLAMGVIMACFAEVSSRFSQAGGPYLYARASFGRLAGVLVAWLLYLAQAAAPAANVNLFVIYLAEFWPGVLEPWPRLLMLSLLVAALTIINLLGVRQGTIANNVFTILKILALAGVVVAGAVMVLKQSTPIQPAATHVPLRSWLRATVFVAFLFGGFESALAPMGEAKDPRRDARFALFSTLIGCGVIYVLIQWVVTGILGSSASTERPLAEVARIAMGSHGAAIVAVSAMVSVYGYLGAKLLGMPRVTFSLAEQGDLPRIFSSVSRFHTPWFSILLYAVVIWILAGIGSFVWNVSLSVISRLFYYGLVCVAVIVLRAREGPAEFRLPGGFLLPLLGVAVCLMLATQVDARQSNIVCLTVLAALLHWTWLRIDRRKMERPLTTRTGSP